MPERNQKVQDRIREELKQNPGATTGELQSIAQGVDSSVGGLSLRQFNAGYVLPLKRGGGARKPAKKGKTTTGGTRRKAGRKPAAAPAPTPEPARPRARSAAAPEGERERVRATLMQFARDFSEAETKSAIVAVLSDVDRYVDRIVGSRR